MTWSYTKNSIQLQLSSFQQMTDKHLKNDSQLILKKSVSRTIKRSSQSSLRRQTALSLLKQDLLHLLASRQRDNGSQPLCLKMPRHLGKVGDEKFPLQIKFLSLTSAPKSEGGSKIKFLPWLCCSVDWAPAYKPKVTGSIPSQDTWSGLQARSPGGGLQEATDWYISPTLMFLFLSFSLLGALSKNK